MIPTPSQSFVAPQWHASGVAYTRGAAIEMVHSAGAIAVHANGTTQWELGNTGQCETHFRSSLKLWQAMPLVWSGAAARFQFTEQELALAVSSHNGEPRHTAVAQGMLDKMGLPVSALKCGTHGTNTTFLCDCMCVVCLNRCFIVPYDADAAFLCGRSPSILHNNCSGKHCGVLYWLNHFEL
jgi:L-asparaginase II